MKATLIALTLGTMYGGAQQMKIDPARIGDTPATLAIESPDLASYKTIPLLSWKAVHVTLSTFAGCPANPQEAPPLTKLGEGQLTPKQNTQSVTIPGDSQLAIFADSKEQGGGNTVTCARALRFHSEAGKQYLLRFTTPRPWHVVDCNMTLVESVDGREVPVPSAHDALLEDKGFWKGSDFNICAESQRKDGAAP
jgi:hypothetical protein